MKLGIVRLYTGTSGKIGYYNIQEIGLAKALEKKGIKTDIFFLVNKNENATVKIKNISENIRVVYIPALKLNNHGIVSPKFLLNYNLDIVHILSDNQLIAPKFIKFLKMNNIPVYSYIGTIESDSKNKIKKFLMDIIAKRIIKAYKKSIVIAKTPSVQRRLIEYGVNNIKVIPVGLDLEIVPNIKDDKSSLRKKLYLPEDKNILIFVGRLEKYKNPELAVTLLNEILKINKNYFLVIVGQGSLKNSLIDRSEKLNIRSNIRFIDQVRNADIHKYYKASDIFLNLNDKEIFGMSILEAMYQGCKIVAANAPGPNYIIENKKNGILIDNLDYNKWIQNIIGVTEDENIGINARKRILNKLNWDVISDYYVNLFKELIGEFSEKA